MAKLNCTACKDEILNADEALTCSGICRGSFHFLCGGFSESAFRKLTSSKKKAWSCVACVSNPPKTRSTVDPATNTDSLAEIKHQYMELKNLISARFDDLNSSIQELRSQIHELQTSNCNLKKINDDLSKENVEIKKELKSLKCDVIDLKQYSRRCNFEITNLPEPDGNEDMTQVLSKIGELVSVNLVDNVAVAHRVPSYNRDRPKPIVVQLKTKETRDILLGKLRAKKLSASNINSRFTDIPVFFNEHLAPELKSLFYQARKFKVERNFKYCWVKNGKIFLRENDSSSVIRINSLDDLSIQPTN